MAKTSRWETGGGGGGGGGGGEGGEVLEDTCTLNTHEMLDKVCSMDED